MLESRVRTACVHVLLAAHCLIPFAFTPHPQLARAMFTEFDHSMTHEANWPQVNDKRHGYVPNLRQARDYACVRGPRGSGGGARPSASRAAKREAL